MGQPNNNPFNKIKCTGGSDVVVAQPGNGGISIVQGANTLFTLPFNWFLPVNIYQYKEFYLQPNTSPSTGANSMQLEACNTTNDNGEDSAVIIIVEYPDYDVSNEQVHTDEKYIKYVYPIGGQEMNIGKIMMLTGTNKAGAGWDLLSSPGGMLLYNPHPNFAVKVKVLILA
jgi:hypothetical protein